jgi:GGDEF domain-containing protein
VIVRFDCFGFEDYAEKVGFARADEVVAHLGKMILERVRDVTGADNSFVGHLGGIDFVAVCPSKDGARVADDIVRAFDEEEKREGGHGLRLVAAIVTAEGAGTTDVMAHRLAQAMRAAKETGKSCVLWTPDLAD